MPTKAWSYNALGRLGVGDLVATHLTPVSIAGTADFIAVSGDGSATLGLFISTTGTVYFAGWNQYGQFGDGTAADASLKRSTPTLVPGLSNIVKVTCMEACYALDASGNLYAWGSDANGELARVSTGPQLTPTLINTDVVDVSAGYQNVIVLKTGGVVQTCGFNYAGEVNSSASGTHVTSWRTVTPGSGTVVQVAGGYSCFLLRMADGSVLAAGLNTGTSGTAGQLGVTAASVNAQWITLPYTNAIDVWTGYATTFCQKADGTIWGMGRNSDGNLGTGAASGGIGAPHVSTPSQWLDPGGGVTFSNPKKSAGVTALSFSVLGSDGKVYTWGAGSLGEMGNGGTTAINATPASTNGLTGQKWAANGMWSGDQDTGAVATRRSRTYGQIVG